MTTAIEVEITGLVQGVGFRWWVQSEAERLRLSGWVRNRSDGSVQALFAGPEQVVAEMAALCWRGPPHAKIADVAQRAAPAPSPVTGFRIIR